MSTEALDQETITLARQVASLVLDRAAKQLHEGDVIRAFRSSIAFLAMIRMTSDDEGELSYARGQQEALQTPPDYTVRDALEELAADCEDRDEPERLEIQEACRTLVEQLCPDNPLYMPGLIPRDETLFDPPTFQSEFARRRLFADRWGLDSIQGFLEAAEQRRVNMCFSRWEGDYSHSQLQTLEQLKREGYVVAELSEGPHKGLVRLERISKPSQIQGLEIGSESARGSTRIAFFDLPLGCT